MNSLRMILGIVVLAFIGPTFAQAAAMPGDSCAASSFGASLISDDQQNIVICLKDGTFTNGQPNHVWKSQTSSGVPVGTVIVWPSAANPKDAEKWLDCYGQTITADKYPELVAAIGSQVPDYRGQFLRGVGGKSAALGAAQSDGVYAPSVSISIPNMSLGGVANPYCQAEYYCPQTYVASGGSIGTTVSTSTGSGETRPVNKAVRFLIRAKP